jgi:hypothetical protein
MKKTHLAVAALAIAIAAAPLAKLQAAGLVAPGSKPLVEGLAQVVKAKKAMKHKMMRKAKHKGGRHARSRGPGRCGENMFFKKGKCMDARDKA